MTNLQLEHWILEVASAAKSGVPSEDSRCELKAEWPDPVKAARRLAGHANAARSSEILWIIGIDEKQKTIRGAESQEQANWQAQVSAQFDSEAPALSQSLNVRVDDKIIVGLLFDVTRVPYVVKNPTFSEEKGAVEREVPIRSGTRVRSATRADLIALLAPLQYAPTFEIVSIRAKIVDRAPKLSWHPTLDLFVVPAESTPIVIPSHRCAFELECPGIGRVSSRTITFKSTSTNITAADSEAVISGAGRFEMRMTMETERTEFALVPLTVRAALAIAGVDRPVVLSTTIDPVPGAIWPNYQWGNIRPPIPIRGGRVHTARRRL